MAARKTKLIIYKNDIKVDSLYSSVAFTSIDQLQEFLKKKGYSNFLDSELEYILENQEVEGDDCCQALTPITPQITLSTVSDTYVDLLVPNYDNQEELNTYYLEVITDSVVVQTIPITSTSVTIEGLGAGVIYTFKVYSVTCSTTVYTESTAQTLPITVRVIVVGLGSSPQSLNNDQTHTVASGSDFTISFDGGVFNNTELWYLDSIIRDTADITSSATVTTTISTRDVDGSIILSNILQNTEITITFTSRYAEWCTDTSCIACNETSETATLNTLYVREDGLEVTGSPFTVLDGTTAQTIADTYFISLELATLLMDAHIVDSEGICCFDESPELSNLAISLIGTASFVYTFESDPVLGSYSVVVRKQPTNVGVQSKTITSLSDTITGLDNDADYTISITGANCGGTNSISTDVTTEVLCDEFAPELNPVVVTASTSDSITISFSCVQEYLGWYTLQLIEVFKGATIRAVSRGPIHTFTDLPVNGGTYTLTIAASNCNGTDILETTVNN